MPIRSRLDEAMSLTQSGLSVIPIRCDGSKAAAVAWKDYQERIATPDELAVWFRNETGLAIVTGAVSGGLEVVDVEAAADYGSFLAALEAMGDESLPKKLLIVRTPSGGLHLIYRCPGGIEGNQALAVRPSEDGRKVLIETRGEGGYFVAPGSHPDCHPTGKEYIVEQGSFDSIPTISTKERQVLLETARSFDECVRPKRTVTGPSKQGAGNRPGDDFNRRASWAEILEGWTTVQQRGEVEFWRRPGRRYGYSATVNYGGTDRLYVFSTSTPFEANTSYTKFAAYAVVHHDGYFSAAAADLAKQGYEVRAVDDESADGESEHSKPSQADKLLNLVLGEDIELFHDQLRDGYVRIRIKDHYETCSCRSKQVRQHLARLSWEKWAKAPGAETIKTALNTLEAKACFDGPQHELHNRVAWHQGSIYYDLGDWRAIRVTANGWGVDDSSPTLFRRYSHQQAQGDPLPGGNLDDLFRFVNLKGPDRILLKIILVTSLVPGIAHPIPVGYGPQGSAKTTFFRILRRIIDPSVMETLSFPRNPTELVQQLDHHWMAAYDNISKLPDWAADALCRAVTGEGFSKRELYSDDEDIIYHFRRCIGLNGINIVAQKADLLDRSILLRLDPIPDESRIPEAQLWEEFEELRPSILGAALDALSRAMVLKDSIDLKQVPRMADFVIWGCAIAWALGLPEEDFLSAYGQNIRARNEEIVASSPVALAVSALVESRSDEWEGTATELLHSLNEMAEDRSIDTKAREWPKAPNALVRRLNEVQPNLAAEGIEIETKDYRKRQKLIHIRRAPGNTVDTVETAENSSVGDIDTGIATSEPPSISLQRSPSTDGGSNDSNGRNDISGNRKVVRL